MLKNSKNDLLKLVNTLNCHLRHENSSFDSSWKEVFKQFLHFLISYITAKEPNYTNVLDNFISQS